MQTVTHSSVLAQFGYALSDPTRARILLALRDAAAYPSDLAELIGVSRQSLSNHLACLRGCGLVVAVPEGRRMRYELADPRLGDALSNLLGVVLAADPAHCADSAGTGCC
ncbi:ArsR/SmtB family transcription factor [Paeniglutamicibacter sulfureus]|uniref:DNA-binding transcriptional ArsR family regulator n=1 Tax=Paeniglutamicibacter sulfureus TaxID=43666 RepID=A0ABU2BMH4_9MICC|nr:metalloregulator ArsR/SmtB family transcription factor [Paeniglutamicibacter sulfureus]MDO2935184.1 metalloregulator ArsR/SmtB family transcription factor [Paeniglutamicibacter sulfureus]MDR7359496.1 DNA-binding transcriptional ArsR family regulator [Paeniglutamicibacter sulfureus]